MQDVILNMAWAGHDTTATALTCALSLLPGHPQVIERLQQEQVAVASTHGDVINESALKHSPYLDAVVKELLRHQVSWMA